MAGVKGACRIGRVRNRPRRMQGWGGISASWTPAQLLSLAAWYTAGPTWCFSDAGGTVPCNVGDAVQVWKDRTGVFNVSQATAAARPTLQQVSGRYFVQFDGVNDELAAAHRWTAAVDNWSFGFAGERACDSNRSGRLPQWYRWRHQRVRSLDFHRRWRYWVPLFRRCVARHHHHRHAQRAGSGVARAGIGDRCMLGERRVQGSH